MLDVKTYARKDESNLAGTIYGENVLGFVMPSLIGAHHRLLQFEFGGTDPSLDPEPVS